MRLSLIWAMSRNRVIGRDNALPWHLPDEMRHFVRTTVGHPVIMGRKQFESMNAPLPKRTNIVVTRNPTYSANGIVVAHTLDEALDRAREALGAEVDDGEAMVIGGGEIYAIALPRSDRLYLTLIDADIDGDTYFPEFDESQWREVRRQEHGMDARHAFAFTIRVLDRVD